MVGAVAATMRVSEGRGMVGGGAVWGEVIVGAGVVGEAWGVVGEGGVG